MSWKLGRSWRYESTSSSSARMVLQWPSSSVIQSNVSNARKGVVATLEARSTRRSTPCKACAPTSLATAIARSRVPVAITRQGTGRRSFDRERSAEAGHVEHAPDGPARPTQRQAMIGRLETLERSDQNSDAARVDETDRGEVDDGVVTGLELLVEDDAQRRAAHR